jgi:hypothetical protein
MSTETEEKSGTESTADGGIGKTEAELQAEQQAVADAEATRVAEEAAETSESKAAKHEQRFSKVTRERDEALRSKAEAERMAALALEALQRAGSPEKKTEEKKEEAKPIPPKFSDINDPDQFAEAMANYTEKLTDWTARRVIDTRFAEQQRAQAETTQQSEVARIESEYAGHRKKALSELPDFEEIAENPTLQVTHSMTAAMKSSGAIAPKLLYHLGQHPEEAARIAKLSPGMQFMEIGALKAQLASSATIRKELPKPIKPQGAGSSTTKSIDEMGMEEYAAHRKAQIREARGTR